MKCDLLINELNCKVLFKPKNFDSKELIYFTASDLMSDVLAVESDVDLLITSLSTNQAIRTADIVNAAAVLIVNNKPISTDMQVMAEELGVALLHTHYSIFDTCGRIHNLLKQ